MSLLTFLQNKFYFDDNGTRNLNRKIYLVFPLKLIYSHYWMDMFERRQNEEKGSDFPSTLVISEKLDFFEIPSKLLEKVLLEIQPSQLVMPSILVSSRKKRLKIHHCHLHYLPPQSLSSGINMVGRSTNTCHHPSPLAWPSVLLHYSLHCNATS